MPVVVMKATEGFADRFQVLSHCIRYCITHDAYLCVDWTDGIWGNGKFDFHDVFELINIKTMTRGQVAALAQIPGIKIRPSCWTALDIWNPTDGKTGGDAYIGEFMTTEDPPLKREGDILVTNGQGNRGWWTGHLTTYIRIRPNVSEQIKALLTGYNPNSVCVHLRGTDRPDPEFMWNAIATVLQFPENAPVNVVTDQKSLYDAFVKEVPRAKLVNPRGEVFKIPETSEWGTHHTIPPIMKEHGVDKWRMMIELLADFVALWGAQWTVGKTKSYYYRLAREFARMPQSEMKNFLGWTVWEEFPRVQEEVQKT